MILHNTCPSTPVVASALELFRHRVSDHTGLDVIETAASSGKAPDVTLALDRSLPAEAFSIADTANGVVVSGGDDCGVLYGIGKLLRMSRCEPGLFAIGPWRGTSAPASPIRGMYFATHFHNYYHDAPIPEVARYIGEIALWGVNSLMVWFDMHHFNGIDDPAAQAMLERLHVILRAGKAVGMKVGLGVIGNEAYANSPVDLRAENMTGRPIYGVELCPHKPGALDLILRQFRRLFDAFGDVGLDQLWIWPYDQGGCACKECMPWGARGLLKCAEPVARLFRERWPNSRIILSTWLFDFPKDIGEWRGLTAALAKKPDWLDYLLIEGHQDHFPPYPLEHGVPGGLPALNFPEISMWQRWPWGGLGANPLPAHFQKIWNESRRIIAGGFPYSEGIFEDMNKAITTRFQWDRDQTAMETVREYIAYEFSPEVVDEVARAVEIMERNNGCCSNGPRYDVHRIVRDQDGREHGVFRFEGPDAGAAECWALLNAADRKLSPPARQSWRWRIVLLCGLIDRDLRRTGGIPTAACEEAFEELIRIYHAEHAEIHVCPPSREAIRRHQPLLGEEERSQS